MAATGAGVPADEPGLRRVPPVDPWSRHCARGCRGGRGSRAAVSPRPAGPRRSPSAHRRSRSRPASWAYAESLRRRGRRPRRRPARARQEVGVRPRAARARARPCASSPPRARRPRGRRDRHRHRRVRASGCCAACGPTACSPPSTSRPSTSGWPARPSPRRASRRNRARLISGRGARRAAPPHRRRATTWCSATATRPSTPTTSSEALRLLRPGGVVAFDNALWHDRVADPAQRDADTVAIRELGRDDRGRRAAGLGAAAGRRRPARRREGVSSPEPGRGLESGPSSRGEAGRALGDRDDVAGLDLHGRAADRSASPATPPRSARTTPGTPRGRRRTRRRSSPRTTPPAASARSCRPAPPCR